ncbi:TraA family conjugative transfer protein [Noviherbaspirillum sp. CPCC 100848]|uniref:TraA family conjugative transfer protein n=1 Tax=Noviherbaspirillum album TaxID=3080276 RepID=A0ABU6JBF7_9BURK|nr:TraA family conjugative transfer protein [Noviherbaspirillum sp. CPCC 100848]MEC4720479.1 TraA family conjugative transfer protein [Noviherbaspirillum sp. CPCC 100848]
MNATKRLTTNQIFFTALALSLAITIDAVAGTDTTFSTVVTNLNNWMTGSLGKVFAVGSLGVGLAIGVVKQSIMSVVTGVAIALAGSIGPGVLQGIFTAVI